MEETKKKVGKTDRLKTKMKFTTTLNIELMEELNQLSAKTMINKSKLTELAIRKLIKEYEENGSVVALEDK